MTDSLNGDAVRIHLDWTDGGAVSTAVVRAVAAALDDAPSEVRPLERVIDPDALDTLFSRRPDGTERDECRVEFSHEGCDVTVHGDGEIVVRPPQ